jgi:hypothetical protein
MARAPTRDERFGPVVHLKARHLVEMNWQEQFDDNRLNCLRHIGDFDDSKWFAWTYRIGDWELSLHWRCDIESVS